MAKTKNGNLVVCTKGVFAKLNPAKIKYVRVRLLKHRCDRLIFNAATVSCHVAIFEFNMHQQSHVVHRLPVHMPNNHFVYFQQGQAEEVLDRAADQATKLIAWFVLNAENHDTRQYMYPDILLCFVFNKNKVWKSRQGGHGRIMSRMYSASPRAGELFYLRILLLHKSGATSFKDLQTVIRKVAETFRDACLLRGLPQDDTERNKTLQEAVNFQLLRQ
ncbi:uncharacterized protein LOC130613570 [Hydractinia symbiolongicarpus]|uniref:uncharacterized protein LOC130613570 n=1 Tax=Hydractinia symbiolongicarpus TaxID=13093 RepID=UPI00254DACD7|nr:uncharacterized protein LOC130613570 [Hydractinia symbiolongicarpus]